MRIYLVSLLSFLTSACAEAEPPSIDRLTIWAPGLEVIIDNRGNGRFSKTEFWPEDKVFSGRFVITPERLTQLRARIEPFRRSDDTLEEADFKKQQLSGEQNCAEEPVTDQGHLTFHWLGSSVSQYYSVDYGCEREKNSERNKELRAILSSLPVPEPAPLP